MSAFQRDQVTRFDYVWLCKILEFNVFVLEIEVRQLPLLAVW